MKKSFAISLLLTLALVFTLYAAERVDLQVVGKIKTEGFENSQVMETLSWLTDVYGPRLTGSPNYMKAAEWARDRLADWGLENAHLEPWGTFGRGWATERFSVEMTEPQYMPMIAYPKAWTPGTDGLVSGTPVLLDIKSDKDFEKYSGSLRGAIVMIRPPKEAETSFYPDAERFSDEELKELALAPDPANPTPWWKWLLPSHIRQRQERRDRRFPQRKLMNFLREEGAAVILEPSRGSHGTIFVGAGGSRRIGSEPALPALVVAAEHYNRVARLLEKGLPVKLEVMVQNRFFSEDSLGYNVVAEIPGSDRRLKNQVVMLGAHFDSWHAGTGATDNATGSAVAMEAVRILKAIGVRPRRTIRIALWGGEEQGLLGSRGYVKEHFGDAKTMQLKPEHATLSAYFNVDNGTGKIRGVYLQGNEAVRPIFRAYLEPFHDLGATILTIRKTGGTDHLAFDAVGLPGFQFIQDPVDYMTRTHHTNMDLYDHAIEGDLMHNAVILASFVYHTAMREDMLPRKPLPKPRVRAHTAQR
jgi:hypothetical protein